MKTLSCYLLILLFMLAVTSPLATQICIDCHKTITANIVSDWQLSKHSQNDVECSACHGEDHKHALDFGNIRISTPETCAPCHEERVEQYEKGKQAVTWAAMTALPTAHFQPMILMQEGCGGCYKIGMKTKSDIKILK
jgi:hydroxylamine dehydrogenase